MATIGLVGVGGYGAEILRGAIDAEEIRIKAVCDADATVARDAARQAGAKVVPSLKELLKDDEIEGVVLATPNPLHQQMLEQVVSAGRHVFVEKPIANTLAEGIAMVEAAKEADCILMVGHNTRRAGGFRAAKRILETGGLGTLISMEACFSHSGGLGTKPESWRYRRETCPAVPLLQLGIHPIDTMHNFAGPTKCVSSFMRSSVMAENDDSTVTLLEFASGVLATLHSHYVVPGINFINLYGTDANLHVEWERIEKTMRHPYGTSMLPVTEIDTQREEMNEFARCIDSGEQPETDGEGALAALAVVEAAVVSAAERRIVTISEVMEAAQV